MNNTFEIIGKLSIGKETEKFKPYLTSTSEKGWTTTRLLFNTVAGDNRHLLEIKGLYKADGTGKIYTFTKGSINEETHEKIKGEKLELAWEDRNKPENIEKVAEFKKFIVDLEEYGRRYKLEKLVEKFKNGEDIDEELKTLNIDNPIDELENSKKRRKEFLAESDFAEYIYKVINSGKLKDKLFRISGDIVWNEYNGTIYKHLNPTRIYLAEKEAVPSSIGQINVFYNKESLDSKSFKEDKKYYLNGYIRNYDNKRKEDIPCSIQLVLDASKEDEKVQKFVNLMVKQFTVKDKSWKEIGLKVKLLDGSQKIEITEDMLNDFQKEMLEIGELTMDDIKKELNVDVYGDNIQEMVIVNVARGYTKGRKDTIYVDNDFVIKELILIESNEKSTDTKGNKEDDIFDIDDIDI